MPLFALPGLAYSGNGEGTTIRLSIKNMKTVIPELLKR
jgi:hypothetical protein